MPLAFPLVSPASARAAWVRFWVHFHSGPHLLHTANHYLFSDLHGSHHNLHVSLGGTELHRNRPNDVVRTEDDHQIISLKFDGGGLRNDEGILEFLHWRGYASKQPRSEHLGVVGKKRRDLNRPRGNIYLSVDKIKLALFRVDASVGESEFQTRFELLARSGL